MRAFSKLTGAFAVIPTSVEQYLPMMSRDELRVFMYLCLRQNNMDHSCFPSYQTIAGATGVARRKVIEAMKGLLDKNLLLKEERVNANTDVPTSNVYTVLYEIEVVTQESLGSDAEVTRGSDPGVTGVVTPASPKLYLDKLDSFELDLGVTKQTTTEALSVGGTYGVIKGAIKPPPVEVESVKAFMGVKLTQQLPGIQAEMRELIASSWADDFMDFYGSKGWLIGKNPMKVWTMAASRFVKSNIQEGKHLKLSNPQTRYNSQARGMTYERTTAKPTEQLAERIAKLR